MDIDSLNAMAYNVFDFDSESIVNELNDIDPDLCYYNQLIGNLNSEYYSEHTFQLLSSNTTPSAFSIIHSNVRSFFANGSELCNLMNVCNHHFSLICLTETWLNSFNYDYAVIPNYNHICRFRSDKSGGGVSIYVDKRLDFVERNDLSSMTSTLEAVFMEIDKSAVKADRNIVVGCIYRPPKSSITEFNDSLRDILRQLSKEDKYIYLTGDFNINLLNSSNHTPTAEFLELLFSFSFFPTINKPTRITSTSATIIDNIFMNNLHSQSITAGILASDVSDHCPVFCISPFSILTHETDKYITKRIFNECNKARFVEILNECDWSECLNQTQCQPAFSLFYNQYTTYFNQCFPPTKIKIGYRNRKPWLTETLKKSITYKNKLYRKYIKSKSPADKETYHNYKRCLRTLLRQAERAHYDHQLTQCRNNLRKSWALIKEVIHKKKVTNNNSFIIKIDGTDSSDPAAIVTAFNDYFVNVGPLLAQSIPSSNIPPTSFIHNTNPISMYTRPVTELELINVIRELKNNSPGPDGIPATIIKESTEIIVPILTHVINLSLTQGIFPDEMKLAKVLPLFKSGDRSSINNYRPISLLPCFSKIIEKCMAVRLMEFINKHNILYKYQFGFRQKHSTNMALNLLVDKITSSLDQREVFVGVSLDFRKAFDTIDFTILLNKLFKYGVRGNTHKWFANYLLGRRHFVELNDVRSQAQEIQCGVPQGSILGPILFILYINDLPLSSDLLPIIYADDTNLFHSGKSIFDCIRDINIEMVKISDWITSNRLSLNIDKTNFIVFNKSKITDTLPPVCINNNHIKRVNTIKFLGVFIDDKLSWSQHIGHIRNKISKSIGMLSCARRNLNRDTLKKLYFAFIHPYLNYCLDVWGQCSRYHFQSLFKLQKRAMRVITFSNKIAHSAPLFESLEVLPLQSMYIMSVTLFMYKFYYRLLPPVIDEFFQHNTTIHSHNTRQSTLLHVPIIRSQFSMHSIRFRGVLLWNQLPQFVNINELTFNQFKSTMRLRLLSNSIPIRLAPLQ